MPLLKNHTPIEEVVNHINDDYKNLRYNYERHILQNVVSPELFGNALNDVPYRQIERLSEYLINAVRSIKLTYASAFPKNSKLIN